MKLILMVLLVLNGISNIPTMKTYYCDFGWRGGVVVVADNAEEALKLISQQSHNIPSSLDRLTEIKPGEVYTFFGGS